MLIHYVQHASFEPLGAIETWAMARGYSMIPIRLSKQHIQLPDVNEINCLISMGGPQSVLSYQEHDYLVAEVELLAKLVAANRYVLGICLGTQLLSVALGGVGEPSPYPEIGIFPVSLTNAGANSALLQDCPSRFLASHWHNDMPGLPDGAEVLAESEACPRQIIQFAEKALGLQCHLEFNANSFQKLIDNVREYPAPSKYIQTTEAILSADFSGINEILFTILDRFIPKQG